MRFAGSKNLYPVNLTANFRSHWGERPWTPDGVYGDWVPESLRGKPKYRGVQHDECPKIWPWWRVFAFYFAGNAKMRYAAPTTGSRLWIYTRWGSGYIDLVIDRRDLALGRLAA